MAAPSGTARMAVSLQWAERILGWITEIPAAILVVAEIVVMFASVVARYVFNRPLIWSDELAVILFIWLTMFGAVIALRRGEHMRLTTVLSLVSPRWRSWLETVAFINIIVFLVAIISPTSEYLADQWAILTSALRIHDTFRVAAIAVGVVLMLAVAVLRLFQNSSARQVLAAVVVIFLVAGALVAARPLLLAIGNLNLIVFFAGLVTVCVAIGTPIAFSFGLATLAYLSIATTAPMTIIVSRMDEGVSELILLSIPLFVVLGLLTEMMGLARALIDFMVSVLGHIRGGLSYVLIGGMFLVSGISGSKTADMAAVAPVLFPEMKRRGSRPGELVALLSATGAMSETIPPSFVLLTMGSVTGISIAALFTGGLLPAAVATLALVIMVYIRSRTEAPVGARAPRAAIVKLFFAALPALALPFIIRATVVEGVATATEVSSVGVVYTLVVGYLVYRSFDVRRVFPMLVATASLSGAILLIIGMATAMAWALTQSGFSQQLAEAMAAVPGGRYGFLAVSIVAFAILGAVLEGIPAVVLFGPLLFPAARALGIHDVHYAVVAILSMGLGLFAPPFGIGFYSACAIGGVAADDASRRIWPYLGVLLLAVIIVALFPWLSTGLL
ncbi:TRAP transporter large permease subunit [Bradyrhizobium sp. NP1]|uniref:TRAP transporter large permease n=1 Tax=Bradyrhizobium sp. NP1 TaxID=3049772 RepID=UPI0025A62FBD|nr:TRAP transporter large permease subunit [Bradyrhizobium sp. NP1]WJR81887.1 TRAP transporter large permease subunit [Bradyrhizobium sp. NP1]